MINKKVLFANIITVLGILLVLEFIALQVLSNNGNQQPYFLNFQNLKNKFQPNFYDYEKIDPLLGWDIDKGDISRNKQIYSQNNLIYYKNEKKGCNPINILITGGSTTDVTRIQNNWPFYLNQIIQSKNDCYRIVHAAVGGYNSGQELLKLIRDGLNGQPDIHVSYSGVNEINPNYVSEHEQAIFEHLLSGQKKYLILPNTRQWLSRSVSKTGLELMIEDGSIEKIPAFWKANMNAMEAMAKQNNYQFIGVLQPAAGIKGSQLPADKYESHKFFIDSYKSYYPHLIEIADSTSFLWDFTDIFDEIQDHVFVDDCHIQDPEYQFMIAKRIHDLIETKK